MFKVWCYVSYDMMSYKNNKNLKLLKSLEPNFERGLEM